MPPAALQSLPSILVVDDTPSNIDILKEALKDHYTIRPALNAKTALKIARADPPPDLILLDIMMPGIDGFEALAALKGDPATRDIPVIFLTALSDEASELKGLAAGAVDYITKPFSPHIVRARVATHLALRQARRELEKRNAELLEERRIVEDILTRMRAHPCFTPHCLRSLMQPAERASGDVVLSALTEQGQQWVLVGDFTGHGLRAAMAAPLIAEIFYGHAQRGQSLEQALQAINRVLCQQLPVGFFMALCAAEIAPSRDHLRLWRGGMPEALLYDATGRLRQMFSDAQIMPLGILEHLPIAGQALTIPLTAGDRLYFFSDGITEVSRPNGEMFGLERLTAWLGAHLGEPLEGLLAPLAAFRGRNEYDDDITLVEIQA